MRCCRTTTRTATTPPKNGANCTHPTATPSSLTTECCNDGASVEREDDRCWSRRTRSEEAYAITAATSGASNGWQTASRWSRIASVSATSDVANLRSAATRSSSAVPQSCPSTTFHPALTTFNTVSTCGIIMASNSPSPMPPPSSPTSPPLALPSFFRFAPLALRSFSRCRRIVATFCTSLSFDLSLPSSFVNASPGVGNADAPTTVDRDNAPLANAGGSSVVVDPPWRDARATAEDAGVKMVERERAREEDEAGGRTRGGGREAEDGEREGEGGAATAAVGGGSDGMEEEEEEEDCARSCVRPSSSGRCMRCAHSSMPPTLPASRTFAECPFTRATRRSVVRSRSRSSSASGGTRPSLCHTERSTGARPNPDVDGGTANEVAKDGVADESASGGRTDRRASSTSVSDDGTVAKRLSSGSAAGTGLRNGSLKAERSVASATARPLCCATDAPTPTLLLFAVLLLLAVLLALLVALLVALLLSLVFLRRFAFFRSPLPYSPSRLARTRFASPSPAVAANTSSNTRSTLRSHTPPPSPPFTPCRNFVQNSFSLITVGTNFR
mmetsp:Transcript_11827/g.37535  ORF Transcript_11827/g.37535 Transcript_11827/m.37535 type:complete len:559 (+) Transcript_11827:1036-2712(+)